MERAASRNATGTDLRADVDEQGVLRGDVRNVAPVGHWDELLSTLACEQRQTPPTCASFAAPPCLPLRTRRPD